jgi:hypothetical protein
MSQKPSDAISFPLSELERGIVDILPFLPDSSRWPAFNAVRHLNRAWRLREIDPQMAIFRAITAEEEAATAIILSLKRRNYRGAKRLDHRKHVHKNAVIPFFDAITRVVAQFGDQMPKTELIFDPAEKKMQIRFKPIHLTNGEDYWAYPTPPLHFSLFGGADVEKMTDEDFSGGVEILISGTNFKDIIDYIRARANLRNEILYAGPDGYPDFSHGIEENINYYKGNVFILLRIYLLIDPYPGGQLFVQQALDAFLKALRMLPKDFSEEICP